MADSGPTDTPTAPAGCRMSYALRYDTLGELDPGSRTAPDLDNGQSGGEHSSDPLLSAVDELIVHGHLAFCCIPLTGRATKNVDSSGKTW